MTKKEIRAAFRNAVFRRDRFRCVMCLHTPKDIEELDAHHICDRSLIPFGGYVAANGISVCGGCHAKAESHNVGKSLPGFDPRSLFGKIGSSLATAFIQSMIVLGKYNASQIEVFGSIIPVEAAMSENDRETAWLLTCETLNVSDENFLMYGKALNFMELRGNDVVA